MGCEWQGERRSRRSTRWDGRQIPAYFDRHSQPRVKLSFVVSVQAFTSSLVLVVFEKMYRQGTYMNLGNFQFSLLFTPFCRCFAAFIGQRKATFPFFGIYQASVLECHLGWPAFLCWRAG
jgi:hypothetical protein